MNIVLYPLEKIMIDGVSVCFGMKRAEVEAALGKGELTGQREYYFNSEMAIDYENDQVKFIEFLCGVDGALQPEIYGGLSFENK